MGKTFTLKQYGEKQCGGFMDFEKVYDRVTMKTLWHVLRM